MELTINDGVFFRKLVTSVKDLTNLTEFTFDSENGMTVQAMDIAHICMIDISLPPDFFETFNIDESPLKLGINFENLNNILKLSGKNSNINLVYQADHTDKLFINITEKKRKNIEFEMKLVVVEQDSIVVPELIHDLIVYLDTDEFQKTIKDMSCFGENCTISVTQDDVTFSVSGEAGTGKVTISDAEIETTNEEIDGIKLTFSTKYLAEFAKANLSGQVALKLSNTVPFCCEYQLEFGHVKFYLGQKTEF